MSQINLIAATEICTHHGVEYTFIDSLSEAGLIKVKIVKKNAYIPEPELQRLEKMIRMHQDLEINIAGIEAIVHLLERVELMQEQMRILRNRMS
jgi:hypothetical protein